MNQPLPLTAAQQVAGLLLSLPDARAALKAAVGCRVVPMTSGVRVELADSRLVFVSLTAGELQVIAGYHGADDFEEMAREQSVCPSRLGGVVARFVLR